MPNLTDVLIAEDKQTIKNIVDEDLAVAKTFTAPRRVAIGTTVNAIDFTLSNNLKLDATATTISVGVITASCIGQSGVITINTAENITGWASQFKFKTTPSGLSGTERFAYFIEAIDSIAIGRVL